MSLTEYLTEYIFVPLFVAAYIVLVILMLGAVLFGRRNQMTIEEWVEKYDAAITRGDWAEVRRLEALEPETRA